MVTFVEFRLLGEKWDIQIYTLQDLRMMEEGDCSKLPQVGAIIQKLRY